MRDDTRKALKKIAKFLLDAGGLQMRNEDEAQDIAEATASVITPLQESVASYRKAYLLMKDMALQPDASDDIKEMIQDVPPPLFYESWLESMDSPYKLISDQFLASQGIHQPYYVLKTISELAGENSAVIQAATARLDQIDSARLEEESQAATSEAQEGAESENGGEEDLVSKGLAVAGNHALVSVMGGFEVTGHESWKQVMLSTPVGDLIPKEVIEDAVEDNPRKGSPTFSYTKFVDPSQYYSKTEGEIAGLAAVLIPSTEWSRAVPYLNIQVNTRVSLDVSEDLQLEQAESNMSLDYFFKGGLGLNNKRDSLLNHNLDPFIGVDESALSATEKMLMATQRQSVDGQVSVGMEVFTTPQSIIPTGQRSDKAFRGDAIGGYVSVDKTRPLMTVKDFTMSVTPAGGTSASQRATLSLTLHDRARLQQVADLLKPATLNNTEFDVEWGWSHPGSNINPVTGDPNNMYGLFINSLRQRAKFTLYQSNYSFTDSGQVELKLMLVTKGVSFLNESDAATTSLVMSNDSVAMALEALKIAQRAVSSDNANNVPTDIPQELRTLTLQDVGVLISGDSAKKIKQWMDDTNKDGSNANLAKLENAITQLKGEVQSATSTLQAELKRKVDTMKKMSYNDWTTYSCTKLGPEGDLKSVPVIDWPTTGKGANLALPADWRTKKGMYIPLGALVQMFAVQPLFASGMYDEIQVVSYTANLNAGAVAGANLGAVPVFIGDVKGGTFQKILENQYKHYGGQYPVSRFVEWLSSNYVESQLAPMYGVKTAGTTSQSLEYNESTGKIVPTKAASKNLAAEVQQAISSLYYPESDGVGTYINPKPVKFTPIRLKLYFEAAPGAPVRNVDGEVIPMTTINSNKTILRIHVVDANVDAAGKDGWLQILANARAAGGKIIAIPEPRAYPGLNETIREVTGFDSYVRSAAKVASELMSMGILEEFQVGGTEIPAADPEQLQAAHVFLNGMKADLALLASTPNNAGQVERIAELTTGIAELEQEIIDMSTARVEGGSPMYRLASNPVRLVEAVSKIAPQIVYGSEGSMVKNIDIKQKTNSKASTNYMIQAQRGAKSGDAQGQRGVPMRLGAADVSLSCFGNPCYKFMQRFFIQANTGTTIDNLYGVSGIEHKVSKESFSTELTLAPLDAYGTFKSLADSAREAADAVAQLKQLQDTQIRQEQARIAGARSRRYKDRTSGNVSDIGAASAILSGTPQWGLVTKSLFYGERGLLVKAMLQARRSAVSEYQNSHDKYSTWLMQNYDNIIDGIPTDDNIQQALYDVTSGTPESNYLYYNTKAVIESAKRVLCFIAKRYTDLLVTKTRELASTLTSESGLYATEYWNNEDPEVIREACLRTAALLIEEGFLPYFIFNDYWPIPASGGRRISPVQSSNADFGRVTHDEFCFKGSVGTDEFKTFPDWPHHPKPSNWMAMPKGSVTFELSSDWDNGSFEIYNYMSKQYSWKSGGRWGFRTNAIGIGEARKIGSAPAHGYMPFSGRFYSPFWATYWGIKHGLTLSLYDRDLAVDKSSTVLSFWGYDSPDKIAALYEELEEKFVNVAFSRSTVHDLCLRKHGDGYYLAPDGGGWEETFGANAMNAKYK